MRFLSRALIAASLLVFSACASAPAQAPVAAVAPDSALESPRLVALEGAQNFRDIGGYRTVDGRRVKWRAIFRSAALSAVTPADIVTLNGLGVEKVYDLRSTSERRGAPSAWTGEGAPAIVAIDYDLNTQAISATMRASPTAASVHAAMASSYPGMLTSLTPEYRELFAGLLAGEGATLYHCTAGKDRTGIATALILSALGVPRETIYADYLMSNQFYHPPAMPGIPPDVMAALMGVDESYLRAVFEAIDAEYGSVEGYLDRELGVDAADIVRLRALYTE